MYWNAKISKSVVVVVCKQVAVSWAPCTFYSRLHDIEPSTSHYLHHHSFVEDAERDASICYEFVSENGVAINGILTESLPDTPPERQSGHKAQVSNITAAKVCFVNTGGDYILSQDSL